MQTVDFSRGEQPRDYVIEVSDGTQTKQHVVSSTRLSIAWLQAERYAQEAGPGWEPTNVQERVLADLDIEPVV